MVTSELQALWKLLVVEIRPRGPEEDDIALPELAVRPLPGLDLFPRDDGAAFHGPIDLAQEVRAIDDAGRPHHVAGVQLLDRHLAHGSRIRQARLDRRYLMGGSVAVSTGMVVMNHDRLVHGPAVSEATWSRHVGRDHEELLALLLKGRIELVDDH